MVAVAILMVAGGKLMVEGGGD